VMDDEMAEMLYCELAQVLQQKLYPPMAAIAKFYEEALRQDQDAAEVNSPALRNLHFLSKRDASVFGAGLDKSDTDGHGPACRKARR
jgi:hypothetical protein